MHQKPAKGSVKTQTAPHPTPVSDSIGLEWGPIICIPNELSGAAADVAGLGTALGGPLIYNNKL